MEMKEFEKFNNFFIEQGLIKYSDDLLKTLFRVIKKSDYKNYFSIERVLPLTLSEKATIYNEIKLELTSFFIHYDMFDNKISTNPFSVVLKEYTDFILIKNDKCEFVENLILDLKYCLLENKELEIELIEADGGYRGKKETQRFDLKIQTANLYLNELRLNRMDRVTHLFLDLCRNSFEITFLENQLSEFENEKDRIMYINYIMNEFEKKQIYDWMRTIEIYNETGKLYGYDDLSSELGTFGFYIVDPNEEISFNETTYGMKLEMCLNDFIRQCKRLLKYLKQQQQTKAKSEMETDAEIKLINNKNMALPKKKLKAFISYSKFDGKLCKERDAVNYLDRFKRSISPLTKHHDVIEVWDDTMLQGGSFSNDEIVEHLQTSDIIFYLVSNDFLSTNYIIEQEMTRAQARHLKGECTIFPVILKPCGFEYVPYLKDITAYPSKSKVISKDPDKYLKEVFDEIIKIIKNKYKINL